MLKRNSNFTLIELIVVIVVLGILAAIVIPNISSFAKQAREAQYTADLRNIQTGFDMESAKSDNLESGLVIEGTEFKVTTELDSEVGYKTVDLDLKLVDVGAMVPSELRKLPKYVVRVSADDTKLDTVTEATAAIDNEKKYVFVAVQVDALTKKSKAVLNYVGKNKDAITQVEDTAKGIEAKSVAVDELYIVR